MFMYRLAQFTFANNEVTPVEAANKIIAYAILAAFLLSVVYVFFGGFRFIFSGGDEQKVKTATNTIRHAILGLIITILATFIVSLIGKLFGLDVIGTLLDTNEILNALAGVIDRLGGGGEVSTGI